MCDLAAKGGDPGTMPSPRDGQMRAAWGGEGLGSDSRGGVEPPQEPT